jgi:hypothetical protein
MGQQLTSSEAVSSISGDRFALNPPQPKPERKNARLAPRSAKR